MLQHGQEQRECPDENAGQQSRNQPFPSGAAPVKQTHDTGKKLGDGDEGNQAQLRQSRPVFQKRIETVTRKDDQTDQQASAPQQPVIEVQLGIRVTGGQQQVVHAHGRQCEGGDDNHGAGSRNTADKGDQRQPGVSLGQSDAQHEIVGISGKPKIMAGPEDDRDGQVQQQQEYGKRPAGEAQIVLFQVFRKQHVELSGQQKSGTE